LQIVGRNKDLIISGGFNIYPKEIELLLDEEEHVLESAVIGVPHPDFGETVVGVIIADGDNAPDLETIMLNIHRSLARFKHPQRLVILPELELLSNLVFEGFWSCCDLVGFGGFNSVFECDACDDFGEIVKAA
jgi:acyl-CoA synthetase (AMP-forming)/AMP-acid ligase II